MNSMLLIILTLIAVYVRNSCLAVNSKHRYQIHTRVPFDDNDHQLCQDVPSYSNHELRIKAMTGITSDSILVLFSGKRYVYIAKPDSISRYPYVTKREVPYRFQSVADMDAILMFPITLQAKNGKWEAAQAVKDIRSHTDNVDVYFTNETQESISREKYAFFKYLKQIKAIFELQPKRTIPMQFLYYIVFREGEQPQTWKYNVSDGTVELYNELKLIFENKNDLEFDKIALFNGFNKASSELIGIRTIYNSTLFQFFTIKIQRKMVLKSVGPFLDTQVLFGCPQSLCIYAAIDAASFTPGALTIVSGKFHWEIDPYGGIFNSSNAQQLNKVYNVTGDPFGVIEDAIDAIFLNESNRIFIMGTSLWIERGGIGSQPVLFKRNRFSYFNYLLPNNIVIDAATNINMSGKNLVYLFSGSKYYVYREDLQKFIHKNSKLMSHSIRDFGFPSDLDAAYTDKDKVYALKGNYIYEVDLDKEPLQRCFETVSQCFIYPSNGPHIKLFQQHFKSHCINYFYNSTIFNSYSEYILWLKERWNPILPPINENERRMNIAITLVLFLITVLIFIICLLIYYRNALYETLSGYTELDREEIEARVGEGMIPRLKLPKRKRKKKA